MKKIIVVCIMAILSFGLNAQNVFNKGSFALNAGIGLLSADGFIPSVNVSGEFGIFKTGDVGLLSVGGILAYKYSTYSYSWFNSSYNYNQLTVGPRATWHLQAFSSDKWDAYAGVGFGMRLWSDYVLNNTMTDLERKARVSPYGEAYVGGRMKFKEKLGLFAEVGYGTLSSIKVGLTFFL